MLTEKPALGVLSGAVLIAFSGILFRKSHVSPLRARSSLFGAAVPVRARDLGRRPLGRDRRVRRAPGRGRVLRRGPHPLALSIDYVGAGLATVLGNTQVVLVGLLAWALFGERPPERAVRDPVAMLGILLISGVLENGAYGATRRLGAIYGRDGHRLLGFLFAMRRGSEERGGLRTALRRDAGSAICIVPIGLVIGDLDFTPSLKRRLAHPARAQLSGRGLALITVSLGLPTARTSVLLTLQPLLAVIFAALIVDERPSPLQLVGAAAILAGLLIASAGRRSRAPLETVPEH